MKILVNLIGEQPIPNLLPILYLEPDETILLYTERTKKTADRIDNLVYDCSKEEIDPYDFNTVLAKLDSLLSQENEYIFNITGGTKIMAIALFQHALSRKSDIVYLESENNQTYLYRYSIKDDFNLDINKEPIPELADLDVELYLRSHLPAYEGGDVTTNSNSAGIKYEAAVIKAMKDNDFEVLSNIRPKGEGSQSEIDAVFKLVGTNNFGVAEIKIGDREEKGPKSGIDQLALISGREYMGTYTKRFLITQRALSKKLKELALAHNIIIVDDINSDSSNNMLTQQATEKLVRRLKEKLS